MLRAFVGAVVLANLLFWVWSQGWLAPNWPPPRHAEREPERLQAQLHPERVRVLVPAAAVRPNQPAALGAGQAGPAAPADGSSAPQGSMVTAICLEAGPFLASELAQAEVELGAAGLASAAWVQVPQTAAANNTTLLRLNLADSEQAARLQAQTGILAGRVRACGLGR